MRRLIPAFLIWLPGVLLAQDFDFGAKTKVSLLVDSAVAKAGGTIEAGVRLKMPEGWHTYWRNPGENGTATSIKWNLPKGITAGEIHWPVPEKMEALEMFTYAYHHEVLLIIPLTLDSDLRPGDYDLKGKVEWLECEETCIPGEAEVAAKLVVGGETKPGEHVALFQKWRTKWASKDELAELSAEWAGEANAKGERELNLKVPVDESGAKVHFLPFATTGKKWSVAHSSDLIKGDKEITLTKVITSKEGKWPTELTGVVRYETNGNVNGRETVFQIRESSIKEPFGLDGVLGQAKSKVSVRLNHLEAKPGSEVLAGVSFGIPKHWHIFWKKPGVLGEPPSFTWTLPEGITAGEILWPKHTQLKLFGEIANVYEHQVMLLTALSVGKDVKPGGYEIGLKVDWQECDDKNCVPQEKEFKLTLKVGEEAKLAEDPKEFQAWLAKVPSVNGESPKSIWFILGGAFLGGMILNIMPCVLPVISMKILGFVQQSQEAPERIRKLGLTYGLGVLFSFLVLAGIMIAVKKSTGMASWGMQMQNPYFNLVLLLVVALVALNLFGVFEVTLGSGTMGKANELAGREGYLGAFFNGMLATALATPCTAPFLAPAMGVAFTQNNGVVIASMCAVAVGLALPFVLLSLQPGWLKFLPKPGNWMVQFKQIMGFPMLAAAIWVLSFTGPMFGEGGVMWLGVFLCVVALAAWIYGEFMQRNVPKSSMPLLVCGLIMSGGYVTALEWGLDWRHPENRRVVGGGIEVKVDGVQWKKWSPEAVVEARAAGHPVLIDFTADWCMSCKYTKGKALEVESVVQKLKEIKGVAFLADWTNKDPVITKALHRYRRGAVPLILVYPPKGDAIVLPPVMSSPGKVLEALGKAARSAD